MSDHIIHVNETDFSAEVLAYSGQRPVVVDFWAEWCVPCRTLDPILEKLARDSAGTFRLAKVDVDTNPKIASDYGVRGIPAVKAFRNGQVVAEFSGLRSESQVLEFIGALAPSEDNLATGKGNHLLSLGRIEEAEEQFRKVLAENPDHAGALLGLSKSLIAQGRAAQSLPILREFPVSREYQTAEQLLPLALVMTEMEGLSSQVEDDLATAYWNSMRLASQGRIEPALDGIFDLLRANRNYRGGEARKIAVGLLHLLSEDNPAEREYRAELTRLLF
ncbi:MAG: tetratricopeptide repeat protein [Anaerolineales bacterium]